ncbi:PLP-dependent aminotransferase family protein [Pseudomonas violetae]|jgi:GntR family transcriptional regulator / MocR family aminotransferase|uniref:PLP-dependent aminotransferase family protein n=1 Tax=Pseudomonas violetae TaxID=2915813 RepID=A0ABT0EU45_9PSED|nr:PLP-dependent aminotransferase family protein [Pseudomonas violetae]MCK1789246.1 PLP-dependent aminotransferase family protein [Pseudomonas violetae]
MELHVVINGRKDLAGQLYNQLRSAIESGRLAAGTQLPPSRLLAEQLGISRKTISDTYAQLTYENYLTGVIGKGTYVNARPAKINRKQSHSDLASAEVIESWRNLPVFLRHPTLEGSLRYDFIGGATSKGQFPQDDWRRCTAHALRQMSGSKGFYSQSEGLPALRNSIARHIAFSRGVNCQDEDVVVCNGAQQALDLISRVLTRPGSLVAMEDPGYPPARLLFGSHGATVIGVPVDGEGIQVDKIPLGTRLIYVTPSHQFPLGMPMSAQRRLELLERAHELGAIIIEDDYDSEFRYEGQPTDSLQSMDERGIVAYVGTFSKTLLPELRLGYAILPPAILEAVIRAKQLTDLHTSTLPQWALAKFIAEGCLLKHIRRCHTIYAGRRERLLERAATDLAPWLEAVPSTAGFHLVLMFKVPIDMPLLVELAKKVEVGLYPIEGFYYQQTPRDGLLMGFGAIETLDIDLALSRLRDILQQVA